jgi:hypothetical protein
MQDGSRPRDEPSNRLLTLGEDAKSVALAIAGRSALRAIPLLERLAWKEPALENGQAVLRERQRRGRGDHSF